MNWWRAGGAVGLGLLPSKGATTAVVASGPGKAMARTETTKTAALEKNDHIIMAVRLQCEPWRVRQVLAIGCVDDAPS